MKSLIAVLMFVLVISAGAAQAAQDVLTIDLAENHIDITTGFNGAELVLFGVQEERGRVAIVLTGPKRDAVVRRKEQMGGIWVNRRAMVFEKVPAYYDYAVAGDETDMALPEVLKAQGIGPTSLMFEPSKGTDKAEARDFQQALVRNRQEQGLFHLKPEAVTYLSNRFFRTTFYIPPNVPTGDYRITALLFRNGKIEDTKTIAVRVAQVGASAGIYRFSHTHEILYGLICVAMAMSIGWLSSLIRRT